MIWTGCVMAGWAGCSAGSGHRRRWAPSCGRSRSATSASSTRSPRTLLVNLAGHTPLLGDVDRLCWVDVDDTVKQTYGYAKQGAGYGYTRIKGLNALVGVLSTPTSAPVIAATRLRKGSTSSPRGAASFVAATLTVARRCGASGLVVARMDSAFYIADVVAAIGRAGAKFSITARLNRSVRAAIAGIAERGVDPDPLPERDLGRPGRRLGVRRRGRRNPLHRVHLPRGQPAGDGPADRAAGQTAAAGREAASRPWSKGTATTPCSPIRR